MIEVYWCSIPTGIRLYGQLQPVRTFCSFRRGHLGFLPQPNILNIANLVSKISELSLFSISSALIHLTTSNRIPIFWNQKCHSSASNPIRCKIGRYTNYRLSRTQKYLAVAAIKLFNRLPEEIESLPDGQFQCCMKRASQLATILPERNFRLLPERNRSFSGKLVTYKGHFQILCRFHFMQGLKLNLLKNEKNL